MSRIAPIERPWPDWFEAAMERTMPPETEPLTLFRTMARSERGWRKFAGGSLLDRGPLSLRERELVIDRTTARCGCDYEWGVHVAMFGERAGLTREELAATATAGVDRTCWSGSEAALLEAVDALIDRKRLSGPEFDSLRSHYDDECIIEIVQLVAFYHGVSLLCGAFGLAPEAGMPTLPMGQSTATGAQRTGKHPPTDSHERERSRKDRI